MSELAASDVVKPSVDTEFHAEPPPIQTDIETQTLELVVTEPEEVGASM